MAFQTVSQCVACSGGAVRLIDSHADLWLCDSCRFVFVSPQPSIEDLSDYYSKGTKYDGWINEESARDAMWKRRLEKMRRWKKPGSVLDVGTGIGQFLHHAKTEFLSVHGTEISQSAVEIARQKYGLTVMRGEIHALETNQKFDNITLFHVLEHVHNPRKVLEKCAALLTPGGKIFIAVPNDLLGIELKIKTLLKKMGGANGTGKFGIPRIVLDGTVDEIHLSQFTPRSLAGLLERTGFKVESQSLDPFFAKTGVKLVIFRMLYAVHSLLNAVTGKNFYNTIWTVARKEDVRP